MNEDWKMFEICLLIYYVGLQFETTIEEVWIIIRISSKAGGWFCHSIGCCRPWVLKCRFNCIFVSNDLLQMSQILSFRRLCIIVLCNFKLLASEKYFSQKSHLWYLWLSWTVLMCLFRFPDAVNDFPQDSHL